MNQTTLPAAYQLDYQPGLIGPFPGTIGLIACGGITEQHLRAYRDLGYPVSVLCDVDVAKARQRQAQFYPQAAVVTDYRQVLDRPEVSIVDVATHPDVRSRIIRDALLAGKHVLSQKPFVEDLEEGRQLVETAQQAGRSLAVNQNARWAPHFSYARQAVAGGLLGRLNAIRFHMHWDHTWTRGTKFAEIPHLLLYDFAIHWFDLIIDLMPDRPWQSVYATVARTADQDLPPPLLAQVQVQFADAQASLCLDADTPYLQLNQTYLAGRRGSLHSSGPDYSQQSVQLATAAGTFPIPLVGEWFPDGFGGAMTELANAILQDRPPEHSAAENLASLELCFSAILSADSGQVVQPGQVTGLRNDLDPSPG